MLYLKPGGVNNMEFSPDTQAILLLTAPLTAARVNPSEDILTHGEYKRLALFLRENNFQPSDLIGPKAKDIVSKCSAVVDVSRLERILGRGFLLSQAAERWLSRSIWVVSRADEGYPQRLKETLKEDAPALLYGCGSKKLLGAGGLAVVGSRMVSDELISYAENAGRLAAAARKNLVSGGARGIDAAAMRGALEADGTVLGVLADSLEEVALIREHREFIMDSRLTLVSPYDPAVGFNVGNAMQRNKLIYALSDAALVVTSDYKKGGTWSGAAEQLKKLKLVPVYVRKKDEVSPGIEGLLALGALPWPEPADADAFLEVLNTKPPVSIKQTDLLFQGPGGVGSGAVEPGPSSTVQEQNIVYNSGQVDQGGTITDKAKAFFNKQDIPQTAKEVSSALGLSPKKAKELLDALVKEGFLEKLKKARYLAISKSNRLF